MTEDEARIIRPGAMVKVGGMTILVEKTEEVAGQTIFTAQEGEFKASEVER